jgi:hypothetical protein
MIPYFLFICGLFHVLSARLFFCFCVVGGFEVAFSLLSYSEGFLRGFREGA